MILGAKHGSDSPLALATKILRSILVTSPPLYTVPWTLSLLILQVKSVAPEECFLRHPARRHTAARCPAPSASQQQVEFKRGVPDIKSAKKKKKKDKHSKTRNKTEWKIIDGPEATGHVSAGARARSLAFPGTGLEVLEVSCVRWKTSTYFCFHSGAE